MTKNQTHKNKVFPKLQRTDLGSDCSQCETSCSGDEIMTRLHHSDDVKSSGALLTEHLRPAVNKSLKLRPMYPDEALGSQS